MKAEEGGGFIESVRQSGRRRALLEELEKYSAL